MIFTLFLKFYIYDIRLLTVCTNIKIKLPWDFDIHDSNIKAIISSQGEQSKFSQYLWAYGITVREILNLYQWWNIDKDISSFHRNYLRFLNDFHFEAPCYWKGNVMKIQSIIGSNDQSEVSNAIRNFCKKIEEGIEWEILRQKKSQEMTSQIIARESRIKKIISFSPSFINTESDTALIASLSVLPLGVVPDFFRYLREREENHKDIFSYRFKFAMCQIERNLTLVRWQSFVHREIAKIQKILENDGAEFTPIFTPKYFQEIIDCDNFTDDLIDYSSERNYISSLILFHYDNGQDYIEDLRCKLGKYWYWEVTKEKWYWDLASFLSNRKNTFSTRKQWVSFLNSRWPAIYQYLENEKTWAFNS